MTPRSSPTRFVSVVLVVLATAAPEGASSPSSGRGESRLVFPDPVVRAGRPLRVELEGAAPERSAAVLASPRPGPVEWPGVGALCLGPPLSRRNVAARGRADAGGVARLSIDVPARARGEGSLVHFQAVSADPAFPEGTAISASRALPLTRDALVLADGAGRALRVVGVDDGADAAPPLALARRPRRLAHDASTARVYTLVDGPPSRVVVMDARDASIVGSIPLGDDSFSADLFAYARGAARCVALESATGRMASARADGSGEPLAAALPDGAFPVAGAIAVETAAGEFVVLPHALRLTAAVVDPATLAVVETVDLDPRGEIDPAKLGGFLGPRGFAARERDGVADALFLAPLLVHAGGAVLVAIDLSARPFVAGSPSAVFDCAGPVAGVVAPPDGGFVYALDASGESLLVLRDGAPPEFVLSTPVPGARPGLVRTDAERLVAATVVGHVPVVLVDPAAPFVLDAVASVPAAADLVP